MSIVALCMFVCVCAVDIREIKEVREGTDSKDFERQQVELKKMGQFCFVVYYTSEFKLKTLSVAGMYVCVCVHAGKACVCVCREGMYVHACRAGMYVCACACPLILCMAWEILILKLIAGQSVAIFSGGWSQQVIMMWSAGGDGMELFTIAWT